MSDYLVKMCYWGVKKCKKIIHTKKLGEIK